VWAKLDLHQRAIELTAVGASDERGATITWVEALPIHGARSKAVVPTKVLIGNVRIYFPIPGAGISTHGEALIIVLRVHLDAQADLLHIRKAGNGSCLLPGLGEYRKQNCSENCDYSNNNEQLDQCKRLALHSFRSLKWRANHTFAPCL